MTARQFFVLSVLVSFSFLVVVYLGLILADGGGVPTLVVTLLYAPHLWLLFLTEDIVPSGALELPARVARELAVVVVTFPASCLYVWLVEAARRRMGCTYPTKRTKPRGPRDVDLSGAAG